LVADKHVADYFEATVRAGGEPKQAANWITGELFRLLKDGNLAISAAADQVPPESLAGLMGLLQQQTINVNMAKEVLAEMLTSGQAAREIVEARGLAQVSDEAQLATVVAQVLDDHPAEVAQYLGGKEAISGWLMGQVMRATRGQANPQLARRLLLSQLRARRDS
jgi:aspartyl-tRNA(Asn)/glutamyl-tRNA(Gln) amidotransferase subunit B